jgi:hypothetical protein
MSLQDSRDPEKEFIIAEVKPWNQNEISPKKLKN